MKVCFLLLYVVIIASVLYLSRALTEVRKSGFCSPICQCFAVWLRPELVTSRLLFLHCWMEMAVPALTASKLSVSSYCRQADGRKVLRSSIREFLCSEAMFHLGIPTTRAGTCVTSDSKVIRDIFYDGNPKNERCTVVLRIASTFIR